MPDMSQSTRTGAEVQPRPRVVLSQVVLCGDPRTAEFEVALRDATTVVPAEALSQVRNLAELREWLGYHEFPDLIVLVQTWPDEFHFTEFLSLPGMGPFSRVICCFGPWCISDGRSRQDFPLAIRVPLGDFRPALLREWEQLSTGTASWQMLPASVPTLAASTTKSHDSILPWTAGRDEIFEYRYVGWVSPPVRAVTDGPGDPSHVHRDAMECPEIRVQSTDRELSDLWLAALRIAGFPTVTADDQRDGQIVLWDVDVWNDSVAEAWRVSRERFPNARIVALTGFSVPDLVDQLQAAGAVTVVSKLLPLEALQLEIGRVSKLTSDTSQGSAAKTASLLY